MFPALQSQLDSFLPETFFKSVESSVIEQLLWAHGSEKKRIERLHALADEHGMGAAISYFLRADGEAFGSTQKFGALDRALKILDADYWQKALNATDVQDHIPQVRRSEWDASIHSLDVPAFDAETVVSTLRELLLERDKFFAERVDGIFYALSGEHVTNAPEGFSKRMILYVADKDGYVCSRRSGFVNDLRIVMGKLLDIEVNPKTHQTMDLISTCYRNNGEWHSVDGGTFRIKVFKKGTAHIEVHPDVAWKLNEVLAFLYPKAIPSSFRKRPSEKTLREFSLTRNVISTDVRYIISEMKFAGIYGKRGYDDHALLGVSKDTYSLPYSELLRDKHLKEKVLAVLQACGGQVVKHDNVYFDFDFEPIRRELQVSGLIPDQKAYQFYPTPDCVAERLVDWAAIQPHHRALEPSAGVGNLAKYVCADDLTCVEVSDFHCRILRQKGYATVVQGDFLSWRKGQSLFDRIVMNPPFSMSRAEAHFEAAASLLAKDGVLVALLPESMRNKKPMPGFEYEWESLADGDFPGVSVGLVMVRLVRKEFV